MLQSSPDFFDLAHRLFADCPAVRARAEVLLKAEDHALLKDLADRLTQLDAVEQFGILNREAARKITKK